jgi:hypothetical protein
MLSLRRYLARKSRSISRWGALWRSYNALDGKREHLLCENGNPLLFRTRAEARAYIAKRYGYIKEREDLRREPHGWMLPKAVRVKVSKA